MSLTFAALDAETRKHMISEIEADTAQNKLYISNRLSYAGRDRWLEFILQAAKGYDSAWLESQIRSLHLLNDTEEKKKPSGGYTTAKVPITAPATLAEGEFNRFYIRAMCLRAQAEGREIIVYRAKEVSSPRAESVALIGQTIDPNKILADLRESIGFDTALGLPPGPNSGLSVRFK